MAYKLTKWQDHVVENPNRYTETTNPDGTITHVPAPGEIIQQGTPQSATNFNNLETGIFAANELGAELMRLLLHHTRMKTTIISDKVPTEPCTLWLKPMGSTTISGSLLDGSGTPIINLSGVHIGQDSPENTSELWVKPLTE